MYTVQPKRMLNINILDILKKHTDEGHRLSQKEIGQILENEYQMKADRKAIKRNLMNLIEFGYDIEYSESPRKTPNPKTGALEENSILSDFYLVRDFTDAELRLLIDGLLFSKHIPYCQCKALIEKIEGLSNNYFRSKVKHIINLPENLPENKELFLTIEVLDEAIGKGRQVSFFYNYFGTDKKIHLRTDDDGKPREYLINPYQMVATNGRYYLVCNLDKYDNVANFRLDRIAGIRLLDTPVKPMKKVVGLDHGLNLPKHMAEHIYMFTGQSAKVKFSADKYIVPELFDWFGKGVTFSDETADKVNVEVCVNLAAMRCWAMQYARYIKLLSPQSLVDEVKEDLRLAAEKYDDLK